MNGFVYVVQMLGTDYYKIGLTKGENPNERIDVMKTYAPRGVKTVLLINCLYPKEIEKELHQDFKNKRLKGEWFQLDKEDLKIIHQKYTVSESKTMYLLDQLREIYQNDELLYSALKLEIEKHKKKRRSKFNRIEDERTWDIIDKVWFEKFGDDFVTTTDIMNALNESKKINFRVRSSRTLGVYLRKRYAVTSKRLNGTVRRGYHNYDKL